MDIKADLVARKTSHSACTKLSTACRIGARSCLPTTCNATVWLGPPRQRRVRRKRRSFQDNGRPLPAGSRAAPAALLAVKAANSTNYRSVATAETARCLGAYGTKTARNAPSNAKFIFGPAKWLRFLIAPPPGRVLVHRDYSQQEVHIAAVVSRRRCAAAGVPRPATCISASPSSSGWHRRTQRRRPTSRTRAIQDGRARNFIRSRASYARPADRRVAV